MSARSAMVTTQRAIGAMVRLSILVVSVLAGVRWYVLLSLPQRTGVTISTMERLGGALLVVVVGGAIATLAGWLVANLGGILGHGQRLGADAVSALAPETGQPPNLRCVRLWGNISVAVLLSA